MKNEPIIINLVLYSNENEYDKMYHPTTIHSIM